MAKTSRSSVTIPRFTEKICESATNGDVVQRLYRERANPGFCLRVGAKSKTWLIQREVNSKTVWLKLGRYPAIKVDDARRAAKAKIVVMEAGTDPRVERRRVQAQGITLRDAMELYASDADRDPRTVADNKYLLEKYLSDWLDKPLAELGTDDGRAEVNRKHRQIIRDVAAGKYALKTDKNKPRGNVRRKGVTTADNVMRHFRLIWNRASKQIAALPVCPTINVVLTPYKPRRAGLAFDDLPKWFAGVNKIEAKERRDFLLVAILTGMRRNDVATMRWEDVDLEDAVLHIPVPKGGEERAFDLPLSRRLVTLLKDRRKAHNAALTKALLPPRAAPWVFGSWSEKGEGHIVDARAEVGVKFILHGLRNTFSDVARKAGVDELRVGVLMNHAQAAHSMTAKYGRIELEELRVPAQQIEDQFFALFKPKTAEVIPMQRRKARA